MATFKTEFAVELHCEACVKTVKEALSKQQGVQNYEISLKDQRVVVEGHAAPSQIARALKQDGRQVIVRGAGVTDNDDDGAAVCIFEAYTPQAQDSAKPQELHALARLVQAGKTTILDLTMKHESLAKLAQAKGKSKFDVQTSQAPSPTTNGHSTPLPVANGNHEGGSSTSSLPTEYGVYIAKTGDISEGGASAGGVLRELGKLELRNKDGYGDLFTEFNNLNIWDNIGRAMVIAPIISTASNSATSDKAQALKLGPGILAGVIARSAGTWSNDKSVCTCSGKTVWEEARESKF